MKEITSAASNLSSALGIRYYVSSFHRLASDLNLLSLNAQIASAKMGDAGKAFKVITSENIDISAILTNLAKQIRQLTYVWAKSIAISSQNARKLELYKKAQEKFSKSSKWRPEKLDKIDGNLSNQISKFAAEQPALVIQLLGIIDDMEKSLRLMNYVKSGILVESSFLENESASKASFQHLAQQMEESADKIREVAMFTKSKLKQVN